jgi:DNA topoisomerase-1
MPTKERIAGAKAAAKAKGVLVIVESPAKALTIEGYLGSGYTVRSSMGHLIDLPKSRVGIDVDGGFEPEYLTIRGRAKLLKELQRAAKKAGRVLLASDNDREGEAIANQLMNVLRSKEAELPIGRIAFNEITPQAIRAAVRAPRNIDEAQVDAQKARRVLDRLVGYNLSPLLWKKVKNGLSAGRVQSVALRLICDREKEVQSFFPAEYWSVEADFRKGRKAFTGELAAWKGAKPELAGEAAATAVEAAVAAAVKDESAIVSVSRESESAHEPKAPFTTSKLLQTAAKRLGFSSKKTMLIAQQLYEGVDLGSMRLGLITYMRTASTNVSEAAMAEVRDYIAGRFSAELPPSPKVYADEGKARDGHEAIRPTVVAYDPGSIKDFLSKDQHKLYALIWERFVASQMSDAKIRTTHAEIAAGEAVFSVRSSRVVEQGFYKVLKASVAKDNKAELSVPELRPGEKLKVEGVRSKQHFTQGPSRYTDASIVRALEEQGIGRPSTYSPIISVLLERYYVSRENRQLVPTVLGRMICDILVEYFPDVVDVGFTAGMEEMLDAVEDRRADWVGKIREFYGPFKGKVDEVMVSLQSFRGTLDEVTDIACEKCGKPMVKKLGRYGYFLACAGFPDCRNTRSIALGKCPRPLCGGDIVARRGAKGKGREFYGCTNYPNCDFISYYKPTSSLCPKCGAFLVEKFDKKSPSHKACINPDCDYLHTHGEEARHGQ